MEKNMKHVSQNEPRRALSKVMHPEIDRSLADLGMLGDIELEQGRLKVVLKLPFLAIPIKDYLIQLIQKAATGVDGIIEATVTPQEMNPQERDKFMKMARKGWKL